MTHAALNATLNGISAILLAAGYAAIRSGKIATHKKLMLSAFLVSCAFLVSYVVYHYRVGHVAFQGEGWIRPVYFALLLTHTALAVVIVPMILITLRRAWLQRFDRHRIIARWTLPLWLYVSVTGVIVYLMVYQVYAPAVLATTLRVEIRNSEVWLVSEQGAKQLTNDGRSKLQATLSPRQDKVAYFEQCSQNEHCTPSVTILDLAGHRLRSFQPISRGTPSGEPCASILSTAWVGQNAISTECHINPSLSEYIEIDVTSGQTTRHLFGYDFMPSPDGKTVAHVGWIPHFAPPFRKSNYLQLDDTTVYPFPKGTAPAHQKEGFSEPPEVVGNEGLKYFGIHEFIPGMAWSPDSQHIALIDCTYDWEAKDRDYGPGTESNRRCFVAVVAPSGRFQLVSLAGVSLESLLRARLEWTNPDQLEFSANGVVKNIEMK